MRPNGTQRDRDQVFQQDRRKLLALEVMSIAFVAMSISFIIHPDFWKTYRHGIIYIKVVGWICAPLFILASLAVAVCLVRPVTLTLAPNGLTIRTVWKNYSRPWSAIGNFRIWKYRGNRMVVFDDAAPPSGRLAKINENISGANSALPTALNVSPEKLLAAVESAKDRWAANTK